MRINLGQHCFRFAVDAYLQENYYQQIYRDIRAQSDLEFAQHKLSKKSVEKPLKLNASLPLQKQLSQASSEMHNDHRDGQKLRHLQVHRNRQFHDLIRDHLIKGDGGPYFETFQELFEPTESDRGASQEGSATQYGMGRSEIKKVMDSYCNIKGGHQSNNQTANVASPEPRTTSKALL